MKKIIFLILLFSWLKSEAQIKVFGPDFRLTRSHRWGTFGVSTSDTTFYTDSLRIKGFKPLRAGVYTTATAPPASAFPGYIIVNSDSTNKPQYSDGTNWVNLPGTGGGGGGSYTFTSPLSEASTVVSIANAAADGSTKGAAAFTAADFIDASGVISIDYANGQMASASVNGFMSTTTQTIAGTKTWSGASAIFGTTGVNANLSLRRTSDGVEVGVIGVSTNPFINTITGTLNLQSGGTTRLNLSTNGVFIGALSSPAGARLEIAAGGTAANSAPIKFNSGSLLTTPVVGAFEFLTDKFYGTITTGTARKEFTLNDAALTSGRIPFATTNGRLLDDAGLSWDNSTKILQLGGTSSSFPGLLRDGASIQVKLADNSANANLKVLDQAYNATTWNGNDEVPTKNAIRDYNESLNLVQGTYTPTLTNSTNLDASTVVGTDLYYQRIGNQVTVWGVITLDVTAATTGTTLGISLPIASSLTALQQLSGQLTSWSAGGAFGTALADATNDRAQIDLMSGTNTSEQTYTIRFTYLVL